MDYARINQALGQEGDFWDRCGTGSIFQSLTLEEQDEFHKIDTKRTIRANRIAAILLLRTVSPTIRRKMSARIMSTLDTLQGDVVDWRESSRNLYGFHPYLSPQNLLNYPSYCRTYPELVKRIEERNARLPLELSDLIERTWGIYFGGAPFDYRMVSIGRDPNTSTGDSHVDERFRVLSDPGYIPHYEKGRVVSLSQGQIQTDQFAYSNNSTPFMGCNRAYLPIHPQTIQNIVGEDGTVDVIELSSYSSHWPIARGRIQLALSMMGLKVGKLMKIHFPNHSGDDTCFGYGSKYEPKILDQSGNARDVLSGGNKPPLIIVQDDFGKGKFYRIGLGIVASAGLLDGRTVFRYTQSHNNIGSEGSPIGAIELNMLTFHHINSGDMLMIERYMMPRDKNSNDILEKLYGYREPKESNEILMPGLEIDGTAISQTGEIPLRV